MPERSERERRVAEIGALTETLEAALAAEDWELALERAQAQQEQLVRLFADAGDGAGDSAVQAALAGLVERLRGWALEVDARRARVLAEAGALRSRRSAAESYQRHQRDA